MDALESEQVNNLTLKIPRAQRQKPWINPQYCPRINPQRNTQFPVSRLYGQVDRHRRTLAIW